MYFALILIFLSNTIILNDLVFSSNLVRLPNGVYTKQKLYILCHFWCICTKSGLMILVYFSNIYSYKIE
jgi:hypothetical protein